MSLGPGYWSVGSGAGIIVLLILVRLALFPSLATVGNVMPLSPVPFDAATAAGD